MPAPAPPGHAVQPGSDPGWDATEQPPAGDPGWDTAPPSGTLPRDPGQWSSGDYSGPITSAPADRGQGGARTMQDVRSAPVPAHGARDARPPANGGGTDAAPTETPNKAPKKAPHTRSQRDTSGYGEVH